ncbi:MAG: DUF5677 domain-containing protein [Opitutaceae bacterium]
MENEKRKDWLNLLNRMQGALDFALHSLRKKICEGAPEKFTFISACQINDALKGYLVLVASDAGRSASPLLVRPILEAAFRLLAVKADPAFITRIAAYEHDEDLKLIRTNEMPNEGEAFGAMAANWNEFEKAYCAKYPHHVFDGTKTNTFEIAEKAGLEKVYNAHYRVFCRFTHAALRAGLKELNHASENAEPILTMLVGMAVEALHALGAEKGDYDEVQRMYGSLNARDFSAPTK